MNKIRELIKMSKSNNPITQVCYIRLMCGVCAFISFLVSLFILLFALEEVYIVFAVIPIVSFCICAVFDILKYYMRILIKKERTTYDYACWQGDCVGILLEKRVKKEDGTWVWEVIDRIDVDEF